LRELSLPNDYDLETGMIILRDEIYTRRMKSIVIILGKMHLYLLHPLSQPDIFEMYTLLEYVEVRPIED